MSVSPTDLLSLSKSLLARATTEADLRNVIGRAYYAAYHAGRTFHDSLSSPGNMPPRATGSHQELAHRLCHPTIPVSDPLFSISRQLGRELMWLHNIRVKADYAITASISRDETIEAIDRAELAIVSTLGSASH